MAVGKVRAKFSKEFVVGDLRCHNPLPPVKGAKCSTESTPLDILCRLPEVRVRRWIKVSKERGSVSSLSRISCHETRYDGEAGRLGD